MSAETTVIDALAVARLARLIGVDKITRPLRTAAKNRADAGDGRARWAWEWATCPWCSSIWFGAFVVIARRRAPRLWDPIARLLAYSHVSGSAASIVG